VAVDTTALLTRCAALLTVSADSRAQHSSNANVHNSDRTGCKTPPNIQLFKFRIMVNGCIFILKTHNCRTLFKLSYCQKPTRFPYKLCISVFLDLDKTLTTTLSQAYGRRPVTLEGDDWNKGRDKLKVRPSKCTHTHTKTSHLLASQKLNWVQSRSQRYISPSEFTVMVPEKWNWGNIQKEML
jgi:hypothetical protein